ncbi:hypothetical protein G3480_09055 [Thiorhodococcus mannitoliphagus]|uniref:Ni,Fe-hydrogenase I large subunit n=2 Tax=Thiorhodococcus mannitoliphagus TaxID=329406 RepID=A0A6P1DXL0_9GAMM|nr:hypothetical protein [Thiorhodococcus mannitoliphagus]
MHKWLARYPKKPHQCKAALGGDAAALDESTWSQGCSSVESLIIEQLLGMPVDAWLREVIDHDSLRHWAETTATGPARLLRSVIESDESALGSCAVAALPELDNATLAACLMGPEAASFIAQPHWGGEPHETSPLSRRAGSALIRALRASHGNGLLTRLSAQILEVAQLMVALRQPGPEDAALASDADAPMPGVGMGLAEAARGRLVHLARLENDRVLDYRILAPTEWNFHARGPVAMGLAAMPDSEDARLRRRAELLIMAIDPCVAYDLSLVSDTPRTCVPD